MSVGLGVLIRQLGGRFEIAPDEFLGKTIRDAAHVTGDEEDSIRLVFTDATAIRIWDGGQSCCEWRHITCDDDLSKLVGGTLMDIASKPGPETERDYDVHETMFVDIITSNGTATFTTHNEHNGYYGGFWLMISAVE